MARIWTKVEQIRAKQAAKPKHSPCLKLSEMGPTMEWSYLVAKIGRRVGALSPFFGINDAERDAVAAMQGQPWTSQREQTLRAVAQKLGLDGLFVEFGR